MTVGNDNVPSIAHENNVHEQEEPLETGFIGEIGDEQLCAAEADMGVLIRQLLEANQRGEIDLTHLDEATLLLFQ